MFLTSTPEPCNGARFLATITPALLAGVLFCGCSLSSSSADAGELNQDEALRLRESGKLQSLDSLLQLVRQRYPGVRLLETELESEDGKLIYELEVLTIEGSVRELEMDASTGALLKDEEED